VTSIVFGGGEVWNQSADEQIRRWRSKVLGGIKRDGNININININEGPHVHMYRYLAVHCILI
jgi:hypothetical protein